MLPLTQIFLQNSMKKILIILSCIGLLIVSSCRNKKEEERRRLEIERIRQDQESARLADEQRLLELQLRVRQDSLATRTQAPVRNRSYYVVIGSFRISDNANNYAAAVRSTFNNVNVLYRRGWSFVTVGGPFGSRAAATRMMHTVLNTAPATSYAAPAATSYDEEEEEDYSEEEEDYSEDEEGSLEDEENEEEDDQDEVESEMEEEEYEEEYEEPAPMPVSSGFSGQAWVMAL
jgi:hypothetical protein